MRVLYIMATTSYRARAFMAAAQEAGVEVAVASDHHQVLAALNPGAAVRVDFADEAGSLAAIRDHARRFPIDAIIATEDDGAVLAARACRALGLRHNPTDAVRAARFKDVARATLLDTGIRTPRGRVFDSDTDPAAVAGQVRYPCVLKPLFLAASRGVIRADGPRQLRDAFHRVRLLLNDNELSRKGGERGRRIMVEDYVPGTEVALEGLLLDGELHVLALFDKPDPLEGPYFEETLYVTPSRHDHRVRADVVTATAEAVIALGLRHGPVHAELRHDGRHAWVIEVAPRSIGGLCSQVLRFRPVRAEPDPGSRAGPAPPPGWLSLERLILEHALGRLEAVPEREERAAGVMMVPIPRGGVLRSVAGVEEAREVPGVEDVIVSIPIGQEVVPLPEGNRYLGFIFARGPTPAGVESALREAHAALEIEIGSA